MFEKFQWALGRLSLVVRDLALGMIGTVDGGPECKPLIKEVTGGLGSGVVGLLMKDRLPASSSLSLGISQIWEGQYL